MSISLSGGIMLVVGIALLIAGSGFFAATLRLQSAIGFLLAVNLLASTTVVLWVLALSPSRLVVAKTTWGWFIATFLVGLGVWRWRGQPIPPLRHLASGLRVALRDRAVAMMAMFAAPAFVYVVALSVGTPENEGDALAYHVARAAFWRQQHAVSYIGNAIETRLNVTPPNAEIGDLLTMLLSGTQRYVGLVQVVSLCICVVGTVGVARRLGLEQTSALFGGLILFSLPVVVTQAWTAQNDLVVAAFLITAAYFLLGDSDREFALSGVAAGLAIGTKFTAVLSLPLLLMLVAATSGRRLQRLAWLLLPAGALGSVWYVVNLANTGSVDGHLAQKADQRPESLAAICSTVYRFAFNVLDLSGSSSGDWRWDHALGLGAFLYRAIGIAFLLAGVAQMLRRGRTATAWALLGAGTLTAITPSLVSLSYRLLYDAHTPGGRPLTEFPNIAAGATPSWYGPLGAIGLVAGIVVTVRASGRDSRALGLVLASAPVILAFVLALTIVWDPWRGRFFIFAYALAAATWGGMRRYRWLSWGVAALACITLSLSLLNSESKPSGVTLLGASAPTVWGRPDWWVQTILRAGTDDLVILRAFQDHVPLNATVAVAPRGNDFLAPYFGSHLSRHIDLVLNGKSVSRSAGWLVVAPGVRPAICSADWHVMTRTSRHWWIARRVSSSNCARRAT